MLLFCRRGVAQGATLPHPGQYIWNNPVVPGTGAKTTEGKTDTRGEHHADNLHAGDVCASCGGVDKFVGEHPRELAGVYNHYLCKHFCGYGRGRMDNAEGYPV